jgi:probable addiction module antidote protein
VAEIKAHKNVTSKPQSDLLNNGGIAMAETFHPFDPAEVLDTAESIRFFLLHAFEVADPNYTTAVLQLVARAEGLAELASTTGHTQEQISLAFSSPDNLISPITLAVLNHLGLELPSYQKLRKGWA